MGRLHRLHNPHMARTTDTLHFGIACRNHRIVRIVRSWMAAWRATSWVYLNEARTHCSLFRNARRVLACKGDMYF